MGFGKLNCFIDILSTQPAKDSEGFVTTGDMVLASVRAYKESKHGSERWANRAAFSEATVLFRFRVIPSLTIDTKHVIFDAEGRYNILSAEDVRGRGMYIECLCERIEGSVA
jgi:head-tail adaptor